MVEPYQEIILRNTLSTLVGILTAIITVILTFWYQQRNNKKNAIKAVKAEAAQNKKTAKKLVEKLKKEKKLSEEGKGTLKALSTFENTAFESIKNTGQLLKLSNNLQKTLLDHYDFISEINNQISKRETLRLGPSTTLKHRSKLRDKLNEHILFEARSLLGDTKKIHLSDSRPKENHKGSFPVLEEKLTK